MTLNMKDTILKEPRRSKYGALCFSKCRSLAQIYICAQSAPYVWTRVPAERLGNERQTHKGRFVMNIEPLLVERFWKHVDVKGPDDCWMWSNHGGRRGYGNMGFKGKTITSSRLSYEINRGPIPPGMYVCHKCDHPGCVNPAHLFLGTAMDNYRDMAAKGRRRAKHKKLTWELVREIREKYKPNVFGVIRLAKMYGVSRPTIQRIVKNKMWKEPQNDQ